MNLKAWISLTIVRRKSHWRFCQHNVTLIHIGGVVWSGEHLLLNRYLQKDRSWENLPESLPPTLKLVPRSTSLALNPHIQSWGCIFIPDHEKIEYLIKILYGMWFITNPSCSLNCREYSYEYSAGEAIRNDPELPLDSREYSYEYSTGSTVPNRSELPHALLGIFLWIFHRGGSSITNPS